MGKLAEKVPLIAASSVVGPLVDFLLSPSPLLAKLFESVKTATGGVGVLVSNSHCYEGYFCIFRFTIVLIVADDWRIHTRQT